MRALERIGRTSVVAPRNVDGLNNVEEEYDSEGPRSVWLVRAVFWPGSACRSACPPFSTCIEWKAGLQ